MNKNILLKLIVIAAFPIVLFGQIKISGTVKDSKNEPLPSANVYLKGTYDGASTDANGKYSFTSAETGDGILVVSFVGYKTAEKKIKLKGPSLEIDFTLQEESKQINGVVISAGSFEASDKNKSVMLKPLDIVSTASANADIYGALNTLPGTQKVGESEGLFVRGGSATETKTIIDEMVVQNPYFSSVPDIPQRGRFSPFLFSGTVFSTGGYSAQYGQALSSTLILKSQDLAPETRTSISLMGIGAGASHTQRWENTSLAGSFSYYNMSPYYNVVKQRADWDQPPNGKEGLVVFRQKTSKTGMFKLYSSYTNSKLALYTNDLDTLGQKDKFGLKNYDLYVNSTYREIFGDDWTFFSGASYAKNKDNYDFTYHNFTSGKELQQSKVSVTKGIFANSFLTFGGEVQNAIYKTSYDEYSKKVNDFYFAGYAESDIFLSNSFAARLGLRYEKSNYLGKADFAPRTSFAYKVSDEGQFNFAYGQFYQTPDKEFLFTDSKLSFEKATHYILNYQYIGDRITFRIEGYYKDYSSLVKNAVLQTTYDENNVYKFNQNSYNNNGKGYAKGIDIFWRDEKTFDGIDYWISYSYLDTKRDYRDFLVMATPTFATPHTVSVVYKQYFTSISALVGASYAYSTGRPYYNPNNPVFLNDKTGSYNNFCVNASFLTRIFDNFTIVFVSLGNVFGTENIFGYHYSADGERRSAIVSPSLRSVFLGVFISLGKEQSVPSL